MKDSLTNRLAAELKSYSGLPVVCKVRHSGDALPVQLASADGPSQQHTARWTTRYQTCRVAQLKTKR